MYAIRSYYDDLLGAFKSALVPRFFIPSGYDECMHVTEAVRFGNDIGAIPAYAYLGDVAESPTGDKKAEEFEDRFLDDLVPELVQLGFKAVTYMPPRNTKAQMLRLQARITSYNVCYTKLLRQVYAAHSDLYVHLLTDSVVGDRPEGITDETLEDAYRSALSSYNFV